MVYTLTFNPSLDYLVEMETFTMGMVNRTCRESITPGGKGLNVSMVLSNLGVDTKALGFVGGFTGQEIVRSIKEFGCAVDFIPVAQGVSRINVKLKAEQETEINGIGVCISLEELQLLHQRLEVLEEGDILVLAGSVPQGIDPNIYQEIMMRYAHKNIEFVVDTTKELLGKVLPCKPFLVKPNHHELGEFFGVTITTQEESLIYGKKMQDLGAKNVLVSMAGQGAVLVSQTGEVFTAPAPKGTLVNSVGAGDSMVAGFLAGYLEEQSVETAFSLAVATGSASAFSETLATREEVEIMLKQGR